MEDVRKRVVKHVAYGYARVSSADQNADRQLIALRSAGVDAKRIYIDRRSGNDFNRPAWQKLLRKVRCGDVVVVTSLDRFGRNYEEMLLVNMTSPMPTHTDPTPLWMTDSSYSNSLVRRSYRMPVRTDEIPVPENFTFDGKDGYTFVKEYKGVRYVTVVNDRRRDGGGLMTEIRTNATYRPYCAPQRITTTLRGVPEGAAIYEFNAEGKDRKDERDGKDVRITRDFEAAEGAAYCAYPEPLKAPELTLSTLNSQPSTLNIRISTASGKPAPGRTIVRVTVTDPDGRVTDESGRYAVENGKVEIPIRFADGDPEGGLFSKWKAVVTDLTTGEHLTDSHLHLVIQESHGASAFANVPGIAAVVGGVWLTNLGYWGFNQYIIQKGLAAKSTEEAQKGLIFAGFLKILIPFIVVLPGICAYYISIHPEAFTNLKGSINVADDAYPWLVRNFTPTGIKGLTFAALSAAIISSLASMLNSTSTLFTMDIYKKYIKKNATDKQLVATGRLTSLCALIIAAIAVKPLLGNLDQAFQYIQEYSGFIYPGIITVFGLGLLWKRASGKAAVWTAIAVIPLGVIFKLCLGDVPFQLRAGYIFIICMTMFVLISLFDKKYVESELPSEKDQKTMIKWAKIMGGFGLFFILAAAVVVIMGKSTPATAYLNDIGFQAFFFFGVLVGQAALWLYSNSKDKKQNVKALPVDLSLFHTSKGYGIGGLLICAICAVIYILLW